MITMATRKKTGLRWYLPRSKIIAPKKLAITDAKGVRATGRFKSVRVVKRTLRANKKTGDKSSHGYWIKVKKR